MRIATALACVAGFACALAAGASAATISVTTPQDEQIPDNACSLREAIDAANNDTKGTGSDCVKGSGTDVVAVPASATHYELNPGAHDNANLTGDLDVTSNLTISGAGAGSTILDGGQHDRVLDILGGVTVTVSGLTVTNGRTPNGSNGAAGPPNAPDESTGSPGGDTEGGGGIRADGNVTLSHVVVTANATGNGGRGGDGGTGENGSTTDGAGSAGGLGGLSGDGGGIDLALGRLTVLDSAVTGNATGAGGRGGDGGQGGTGGTLPTDAGGHGGNSVGGQGGSSGVGGGINAGTGDVTVARSRVSGNSTGAGGHGGNGGQGGTGGPAAGNSNGGNGGGSFGGVSSSGGAGSAIKAEDGTLTISDTTISDNHTGSGVTGGDVGTPGGGGSGSGAGIAGQQGITVGGAGGNVGQGAAVDARGAAARILTRTSIVGNTGGSGGAGAPGGGGSMSFGGQGGAGGTTAGYDQTADVDSTFTNVTIAANLAGAGGNGGAGGSGASTQAGGGGEGGSQAAVAIFGPGTASIGLSHVTIASNLPGSGGNPGTLGTGAGNNFAGFAGPVGTIGGIDAEAGTTTLRNSIVASNGSAPQCAGGPNFSPSSSNNLVFPAADTSCPASVHGDPKLGPPHNNGGLTPTMALGAGSAAIDAVPASDAFCAVTDQRGITRPKGLFCDIGAFELARPLAVTGVATGVGARAATLHGSVTPSQRPTTYRFQFGKTKAYGSSTRARSAGAGSTPVAVSARPTGLKPNTTYHYRLVAVNGDGTSVGADRTFRTKPPFAGVKIATKNAKVDATGTARIKLRCPSSTAGFCAGKLSLTAKVKVAGKKKTINVGSKSFTIKRGKAMKVKVTVSAAAQSILARAGKLKCKAIAAAHDKFGTPKTTTRQITLVP